MGKIPDELRRIIAENIHACRMERFPGRGGGKKCAEAFGVSPQQWSPWERGKRTPDELRLAQLADFFGVSVDWMRHDHNPEQVGRQKEPVARETREAPAMESMAAFFNGIEGVDIPPPPSMEFTPPGSAASFFWLARHFVIAMQTQGLMWPGLSIQNKREFKQRSAPYPAAVRRVKFWRA